MSSQHLSDEAIAAFADGVLRGHARERAARHTESCGECAQAVRVQREAVWALRAAPAPALPTSLADRLRTLPETTELAEITVLPRVTDDDGRTMQMVPAPMAALIPASRARSSRTSAAVVAVSGALSQITSPGNLFRGGGR